MRVLITLLLLVLALPAHAEDRLFTSGADRIRLTQSECTAAMAPALPAELLPYFQAMRAIVGGATFRGCWALSRDGIVHLVFDDGDRGELPMGAFRFAPDT